MMNMLQDFREFIHAQKLFSPTEKILVAVSGGIDSMVLVDLMLHIKADFAVAHCNFGLRGEESDSDEQFVRNWAERNQIQFFAKKFATKKFAKQNQVSTQMAARTVRYAWFEELLETYSFHWLATAHHQNDNIETVLLNLVRGTGLAGLHGILPKSRQTIRPLLFAQKTEIQQYALTNQIQWREDASNSQNTYKRNLMRNQVIPLLKKLNPNLENTIAQSIEKIAAVETFFQGHIRQLQEQVMTQKGEIFQIEFTYFLKSSTPVIELFELIKEFGFDYQQTQNILRSSEALSGTQFYSSTHQLLTNRGFWLIKPLEKLQGEAQIFLVSKDLAEVQTEKWTLKGEIFSKTNGWQPIPNPQIAYLDSRNLQFPLILRRWQKGDFFYPLGMNKRKKMSDFLIDLKISLFEKENIWLLCNQNEVVWVVGLRIDNRYKITSKTQEILKMELITV